jgi:hypothetical protein
MAQGPRGDGGIARWPRGELGFDPNAKLRENPARAES